MKTINLETLSKSEIKEIASQDIEFAKCMGDTEGREIESLRAIAKMFFSINNEVGAFYDSNGF